jgi:hypothetical protein
MPISAHLSGKSVEILQVRHINAQASQHKQLQEIRVSSDRVVVVYCIWRTCNEAPVACSNRCSVDDKNDLTKGASFTQPAAK